MRLASRWWVVLAFYSSSVLNYLDRNLIAVLAPVIMAEFHLTNEQYGGIQSTFSLFYLLSSPLMGWLLDRLGLNLGSALAVGWWSVASMSRGFTQSLGGLIAAHSLVGVGEAAGIPSTAKAAQTYLKQEERAVGSSLSQFGLTIGTSAAGLLANYCVLHWGWRSAFLIAGWLGFLWIPFWYWASRKAPVQPTPPKTEAVDTGVILRDRRMWGFVLANMFSLGVFLFAMSWDTIFFVRTFGLTVIEANWYHQIPTYGGWVGSIAGGLVSMRWIRRGGKPSVVRRRLWMMGAAGMALIGLAPQAPGAVVAAGLIAVAYAASSFASVNLYTMPLDAFGSNRAAFAVSLLTASYGLLMMTSKWIGRSVDLYGFGPVCLVFAFLPWVGFLCLWLTREREGA